MCAGTPMGGETQVDEDISHLHRKERGRWFLFLFSSFFSFSREWERSLLGNVLLLMAPSVATLPLHNRKQGGLTATTLWESGRLCEARVGA
jgi:hypothetical protein